MKKKLLALFIAISIVFSVTGCKINSGERLMRNDFYEYINGEFLSEIKMPIGIGLANLTPQYYTI